ncbi:MAG: helix-turn-helix domain-containing protein [Proteobacteria bacterium]|nr:helix-turn-helix domain-containing protein [Pseudomonadota bacterium]
MDAQEFAEIRKKLNKTQKEMALLLGVSVKAIHSYEQGWRSIPDHVKRQIYFLISKREDNAKECWTVLSCPDERKEKCPAFEFNAGKLCWFINGTLCDGQVHKTWDEKIKSCRHCDMLQDNL